VPLSKYHYIVVEGPIGVGKTSLAKRLAERLQSGILLERPEQVVLAVLHSLPLAYLFGAVDALGFRVQLLGIETSSILLRMLPYLFTLMVLLLISVFQRRGSVPAALGRPYFREE